MFKINDNYLKLPEVIFFNDCKEGSSIYRGESDKRHYPSGNR